MVFSLGSSGSMGDTAETASSIFTLTRTKGDWTGTQALMQALKSVGSVSNRTLPRTTTMSNRAVKLRNINRTNFILERTILPTTANVGTEGSITQGTVQTGFSLYAIPKIYGSEDVILRDH